MVVQSENNQYLTADNQTMYATRRRKRNARKSVVNASVIIKQLPSSSSIAAGMRGAGMPPMGVQQHQPGDLIAPSAAANNGARSNPSKRHRERLNIELESLAELLPFDPTIVQKLDKLSILRLASSYLKSKCYLKNAAASCPDLSQPLHFYYMMDDPIQTLDGFLLVVTTDGELFFASSNVEVYLGFHQSDILHQSVLELIHSEDREMFKEQLEWNHRNARHEALSTPRRTPTHGSDFYLQRSFTARFRCLLDNTSGFVTMDVTGRLQPFPPGFPNSLTGGNNLAAASAGIRTRPSPTSSSNNSANSHPNSSVTPPNNGAATSTASSPSIPSLALFAYCQPFGPGAFPVAAGQIDLAKTFKSKHSLDLSFLSVDSRVRQVIDGVDEHDFYQKAFYNIVHQPDLQYVATAHAELMKRGSCGMLAYRIVNPNSASGGLVWLQTSARIVYRCNKADTILCIHRRLTDDEGEGLIAKRASEFRLPCALFDAVEAASATSQQKSAAATATQPELNPTGTTPGSGSLQPDAVLDQGSDSNTSRPPQLFGDGSAPTKRAKPATKRVPKKQKQVWPSSNAEPLAVANNPEVAGPILAPQGLTVVPRIEGIWPAAAPCYGGASYPEAYYSTSTMAEQFGTSLIPSGQQLQFNQTAATYPTTLPNGECLSYYNSYGQYGGHGNYPEGDFTAGNSNPCLYANAGSNLATLASSAGWNTNNFMANSEKLLSQYGYRFVSYEDPQQQQPGQHQDQQSPTRSSIGGGCGTSSDESPQTTSVIRHTNFAANNGSSNNEGQGVYQHQYPGYATPLPNHPAMFQAQPVYAATPAPQFMS